MNTEEAMQTINKEKHHVLINLDIIFDFDSVLFGIYRGYFSNRNYDIQKLKSHIEGHNLENGLKNLLAKLNIQQDDLSKTLDDDLNYMSILKQIKTSIYQSFYTIKPVIGSYSTCKLYSQ